MAAIRKRDEKTNKLLQKAPRKAEPKDKLNLFDAIRSRIAPLGGVTLSEIPREPMREPPDFSK